MTIADPLSNGATIRKDGAAQFLVSNGMKRWITDESTFNSCGFDWNKSIDDFEGLSQIPEGPVITTNSNYLEQTTCSRIRVEGTEPIYLVFHG